MNKPGTQLKVGNLGRSSLAKPLPAEATPVVSITRNHHFAYGSALLLLYNALQRYQSEQIPGILVLGLMLPDCFRVCAGTSPHPLILPRELAAITTSIQTTV